MDETINYLFFELQFPANALSDSGFRGRDEIEDPLDDFLLSEGIGETTGGGSGIYGSNIDFLLADDDVDISVQRVRQFLQTLQVPQTATLVQREGGNRRWPVY